MVEAEAEAWTRKRALQEVKQILGNKEKEVVWLNKMEVLRDKRRTRKQIQSIGKNDYTSKLKDDLSRWHERQDDLTIKKLETKITRKANADMRRTQQIFNRREQCIKGLQHWDDWRERRKIIMETLIQVKTIRHRCR